MMGSPSLATQTIDTAPPWPLPRRARSTLGRAGSGGILIAILLLATVLRLHGLGSESLWYDEALTVSHIRLPLHRVLAAVSLEENTPPLYWYLMWGWVRLFGSSDFSVRLPSVIAGVASVWMIYRLGRRLFDGRADAHEPIRGGAGAALLAAFLLSICRYHITYCQEARTYSLLVLLCLVSCELFLRLVGYGSDDGAAAPPAPAAAAVAYVLCSAAMLWTHPFGAFALLAQNLFYVLLATQRRVGARLDSLRPTPRQWVTYQCEIVLLFAPWLTHIMQVVQVGEPWLPVPHVLAVYREYADTNSLLAVLAVLALLAAVRAVWWRETWAVLAALLCILPVCVPILASTRGHTLFTPRYGIEALIGIDLLAGGGAMLLGSIGGCGAAVLVAALAMPNLFHDFRSDHNLIARPDVRDLTATLDQHASPGDGICFQETLEQRVYLVYTHRSDLQIVGAVPTGPSGSDAAAEPQHIWFVSASGELDLDGSWIGSRRYREAHRWNFERAVLAELVRR